MAGAMNCGRIRDHSREVRDWLVKQRGIVTMRFPAYAPELNLDEYVWAHTKYARLCNYAAPGLDELRQEVGKELESLRKNKTLLKSFIKHAKLNITK